MIRPNEDLLEYFRNRPACEVCGKPPARGTRLDPHHIKARGIGGGSRLDVALNLVALCRRCHDRVHSGMIATITLWSIVAKREGLSCGDGAEGAIYRLLRTPSDG